jgi:hypothetical protein
MADVVDVLALLLVPTYHAMAELTARCGTHRERDTHMHTHTHTAAALMLGRTQARDRGALCRNVA